jgi:hypothetical protein
MWFRSTKRGDGEFPPGDQWRPQPWGHLRSSFRPFIVISWASDLSGEKMAAGQPTRPATGSH